MWFQLLDANLFKENKANSSGRIHTENYKNKPRRHKQISGKSNAYAL